MYMGLKKQCPRCGVKIDITQQSCDMCSEHYSEKKKAAYRMYDEKKRDKAAHAFYLSQKWKTLRELILNRYAFIDVYLYYTTGQVQKADTVHHIIEISEDDNKKLDPNNLIPVTRKTHEKIHRMYRDNKKATQELLFNLLRRWEDNMKG